jgi:hypothetical protein
MGAKQSVHVEVLAMRDTMEHDMLRLVAMQAGEACHDTSDLTASTLPFNDSHGQDSKEAVIVAGIPCEKSTTTAASALHAMGVTDKKHQPHLQSSAPHLGEKGAIKIFLIRP